MLWFFFLVLGAIIFGGIHLLSRDLDRQFDPWTP